MVLKRVWDRVKKFNGTGIITIGIVFSAGVTYNQFQDVKEDVGSLKTQIQAVDQKIISFSQTIHLIETMKSTVGEGQVRYAYLDSVNNAREIQLTRLRLEVQKTRAQQDSIRKDLDRVLKIIIWNSR